MQKAKLIDNATAGLLFQDSSTPSALDGTIVRATFQNDNFGNLFQLVTSAGYDLIDGDLSQITKAGKGLYVASFTYNTSGIGTQSVNDVVLGSDGKYYEMQNDAISGDDPVGSVTGNWVQVAFDKGSGKVLQVKIVEDTTELNTSSTSYVDTDLVLSITPISTSSEILAMWTVQARLSLNGEGTNCQLLRDATPTFIETERGVSLDNPSGGLQVGGSKSYYHKDSPATMSAITYKVQVKAITGSIQYNRGGNQTQLVLMEIGV